VSYRTLHRYATIELDLGCRQTTVPAADCEPGAKVQVDFGQRGMLTDATDGRRWVLWALTNTPVCSRHMFVWPSYWQILNEPVRGFEAAWAFLRTSVYSRNTSLSLGAVATLGSTMTSMLSGITTAKRRKSVPGQRLRSHRGATTTQRARRTRRQTVQTPARRTPGRHPRR